MAFNSDDGEIPTPTHTSQFCMFAWVRPMEVSLTLVQSMLYPTSKTKTKWHLDCRSWAGTATNVLLVESSGMKEE